MLLGGLARLDGTFWVEVSGDWVHIDVVSAQATLNVPGIAQAVEVTGYLNTDGNFDLTGTIDYAVGTKAEVGAGLFGTMAVRLSNTTGFIGRIDGGAFAVTAGRVEPWGLSDVSPAMLVGSPNETLLDLPKTLRAMTLSDE